MTAADKIAALVAAAVVRTEKERGFVDQMRGATKCSPKQLHWLRGLAARNLEAAVNVEEEERAEEKPAEYDFSNIIAFPGYLCHGKQITHACTVYMDIDSFAAAISEKDYSRSLAWDRARRAGKRQAQQRGNGAA